MLDTIRDMLDKDPFVPFIIVLTSGDRYEVTNPHMVAVQSMVFYAYPPSDKIAWLRLNQIASIETKSQAA